VHEAISWQLPDLMPDLAWSEAIEAALAKLPVALPFALLTIVGGIDCTESAIAAGDEYDTRAILLTEGVASVVAGFMGGVIQTTPYIGHPAYKKMGGRTGYTLATAVFIGAIGYFGLFQHLFDWLPRAAMFPILVFVGLEISAQSFQAIPSRHYPALALAVLPALAYLALTLTDMVREPKLDAHAVPAFQALRCLGNGFIITSLLWAAALATLLDGHSWRAGLYLLVAGVCAFFGVIHSPLREAPIDLPWHVVGHLQNEAALWQTPYHWAASYFMAASLLFALSWFTGKVSPQAPPT
jgi:AGZA family xanthine/uracil permease-like MFS transporter